MPRAARVWYPGAIYHIICRGNHRSEVFRDDLDRLVYLMKLGETMEQFPFLLHCYCLMTNHIHLQIETMDTNISEIMKRINMLYVLYFNKKYDLVGHLFQGRYRSEMIQGDSQFLYVSKYIHLNPVKANMVKTPVEYSWSSYSFYVDKPSHVINKKLVTTEKLLGIFNQCSPEMYQRYVEEN
jgi:putative transposase